MKRNGKNATDCRQIISKRKAFDKWMQTHYYEMREKNFVTNVFGEMLYLWQEDIFHNTYLAVREALTTENEEMFEDMFVSSFKLYTKRALTARVKEIVPEEIFWKYQKQAEEDTKEDIERSEAKHDLAVQILTAAKITFSRDEFAIFKLYFESGLNFSQIGEMFGTTGNAVGIRYKYLCGRLFGMYQHTLNTL